MKTFLSSTRSHVALVNWKAVGLFYSLACDLSYGLHFLPNANKGSLPVRDIFTFGMGPLLAALRTRAIVRSRHQTIAVLVGILILMAWGLGALVDTTKSVLVVACAQEFMTIAVHPVSLVLILLVWVWLTRNGRKQWTLQLGQVVMVWPILIGCIVSIPASAQSDSLTYGSLPKQEIRSGDSHNFSLFDDAFYQNQLFLLGESHGVQQPQLLDFELLKHLNQKVGVRYYIAEVDQVQAYHLNQYLKTGNEATLLKVFQVWIDEKAQWANKDFVRKIQRIRELNQTLASDRQIQFVGIDHIQDKRLVAEYLVELIQTSKIAAAVRPLADSLVKSLNQATPDSVAANWAQAWLQTESATKNTDERTNRLNNSVLQDILRNIVYLKTVKSRETTIFANFQAVLPRLNSEKLYGFWGFFHVLQNPPLNSRKPFACLVKESGLKVVSITCSYIDCYTMVPSAFLPPFWQDKGKTYSRLDKFNNNGELMQTEGIEAMQAASRPNTMTLFALDRPGSFARQTPIRIKYSPFMPQKIEFDPARPMTAYFQYVVLVRNSDMTEPIIP